ncbi:hypothetical protein GH714_038566 [Hevea brasiliensis]|uniref:BAG domain-containing protein n=1 Tax=Hevea brasiliensis TaxID=3981 RepID=A0A6A6MSS7_HEVBR|nr:hypothetical protein GH714_038566 [Hevea brasiliensis]
MEAPKENSEDVEQRGRDASVKNAEDNGMGKDTASSPKRQSSSSPKTLKLSPVCLRVDPLPQKKNGKHFKQRHRSRRGKNKDKVIEVVHRKTGEDKDEEQRNGCQTQQFPITSSVDSENESSSNLTAEKTGKNDDNCVIKEDKGSRNADGLATEIANQRKETINAGRSDDGEPKEDKKELLEEEAALRIQSAYHGFEVGKWELLKKIKQMAKVQEQVVEVRNKICGLESSPDLQKDERQRVVIGETIMSLLLKLDTIQGLHPSLRDVRKSLARELVELLEKLDLLAKAKSSENHCIEPNNITGIEGGQNGDIAEHPNHDACQMMDVVSDTQAMEASKLPVVSEEQTKCESDVLPVFTKLESHLEEPELMTENHVPSEIKQTFQLPSERSGSKEMAGAQLDDIWCDQKSEERSESVEVNESKHMDNNSQVSKTELPENVTDKEPAASAEDPQIGTSLIGLRGDKEVESNISRVVDDEESEKQEQTEIQDNEVLRDEDVECEAAIDALELQPKELHKGGQLTIDDGGVQVITESEQQPMELLNEGPTETEVSSPDEEVPIRSKLKQQSMEEVNERLFVAEPHNWLDVASEKDGGCPRNAMPEADAQQSQSLLFNKDDKQREESPPGEKQKSPCSAERES